MRATGLQPDGYVLPAYAAATLLETAKDRAASEGVSLGQVLMQDPYPTVLGPVHFTGSHELAKPRYRLLEWRNNRFDLASPAAD